MARTLKPKKITSQLELSIIGVYVTQKHGKPTLQEIKGISEEKLGVTWFDNDMMRSLEGASRRNLVAINQTMLENGLTVKVYSMKDPQRWKAAPEYAMFSDLLPQLLQTDTIREVKSWFDSQEKGGESKATRGNDVDDYVAYRIKAVLLDCILGSQIRNQRLEAIHQKFPNELDKLDKDNNKTEGLFERDENDGAYIIPSDVLQGWFCTNVTRMVGLQDARAKYLAFSPVRFPFETTKIVQSVLPVQSKQGSGAPKSHEAIPAGTEFEINFLCPAKGVLKPQELEKFFIEAGLMPRRGLSPARGIRYGHFLVTSFENLGLVKKTGMDFLQNVIPPSILEKHGAYLKDAIKRLADVSLNPSVPKSTKVEVGSFPLSNGNGTTPGALEEVPTEMKEPEEAEA